MKPLKPLTKCPKCQAPLSKNDNTCPICKSYRFVSIPSTWFDPKEVSDYRDTAPVPPNPDNLDGYSFGRFQIQNCLGVGAMGTVYRCQSLSTNQPAAIKILHPQYTIKPQIVERFFNEARAAALIGHKNLVDILEFGYIPTGQPYFIMEFLQGVTLADYQKGQKRLSPQIALRLIDQVLAALEAVHAKGIIHRDLKPANIFLLYKNPQQIKVLDFGIAKLSSLGSELTRGGSILGTPLYMPPEQARGQKEIDGRADLYSTGIILYELLTGAPPFVSDRHLELYLMHCETPPKSLKEILSSCPDTLDSLVVTLLEKEPENRFAQAGEVRIAIENILQTEYAETHAVFSADDSEEEPTRLENTFHRVRFLSWAKDRVSTASLRLYLFGIGGVVAGTILLLGYFLLATANATLPPPVFAREIVLSLLEQEQWERAAAYSKALNEKILEEKAIRELSAQDFVRRCLSLKRQGLWKEAFLKCQDIPEKSVYQTRFSSEIKTVETKYKSTELSHFWRHVALGELRESSAVIKNLQQNFLHENSLRILLTPLEKFTGKDREKSFSFPSQTKDPALYRASIYLEEAIEQLSVENREEVRQLLKKALEISPKYAEIRLVAGALFWQEQNLCSMQKAYREFLKLSKKNAKKRLVRKRLKANDVLEASCDIP